ncbi:hypothetical protein L596_026087 [Steinernema carpocapsae]|uniref:Uncharacterized protein n=1 Tax=Steinernema carpocapsae TaxID=34508 RepID=A0A4U5M0C8_STECR|nr:hypothetical protein L596_026087 [Steinernema carpocapsae]
MITSSKCHAGLLVVQFSNQRFMYSHKQNTIEASHSDSDVGDGDRKVRVERDDSSPLSLEWRWRRRRRRRSLLAVDDHFRSRRRWVPFRRCAAISGQRGLPPSLPSRLAKDLYLRLAAASLLPPCLGLAAGSPRLVMGRRCLPFVLSEPLRSGSWWSIAATTTQLPRVGFYTLVLGLPARFRPGILYSSSFGDDSLGRIRYQTIKKTVHFVVKGTQTSRFLSFFKCTDRANFKGKGIFTGADHNSGVRTAKNGFRSAQYVALFDRK